MLTRRTYFPRFRRQELGDFSDVRTNERRRLLVDSTVASTLVPVLKVGECRRGRNGIGLVISVIGTTRGRRSRRRAEALGN